MRTKQTNTRQHSPILTLSNHPRDSVWQSVDAVYKQHGHMQQSHLQAARLSRDTRQIAVEHNNMGEPNMDADHKHQHHHHHSLLSLTSFVIVDTCETNSS